MKKIFFFFCFFILIGTVHADTMEHFEVLNGKLSIPFDSKLNQYTVYLIDGEETIQANYTLVNDAYQVEVKEDLEKAVYIVKDEDKVLEEYQFYKNVKTATPVFEEASFPKTTSPKKEIPHLKEYVIVCCAMIILLLLKTIVLGFKKK